MVRRPNRSLSTPAPRLANMAVSVGTPTIQPVCHSLRPNRAVTAPVTPDITTTS
jgi:hypothetical protein